jgi:hypothetical protein
MSNSKILDPNEFEAILKTVPSSRDRLALLVHDSLLRQGGVATEPVTLAPVEKDNRGPISAWIRSQAGGAETVRAIHARKIADLIEAGAFEEAS